MKRSVFATLLFGIALLVAPAAQAHVMSDDGAGGGGVVLMSDTLGGGGGATESQSVPLRPDVLGGNGRNEVVEFWTNELAKDGQNTAPAISSSDSFAWGEALGATLIAAMLLALATIAVTRRRHRLSF